MRAGLWRPLHNKVFAFACAFVAPAYAQTPAPLAAPDLPLGVAGSVNALVRQPDGGLVFGGRFTMVDGVARRNIARLTPDGTLDPDWNPSANDQVDVLATDAAGNVYAGGRFTAIGGRSRHFLAKLAAGGSGAVFADWDPDVDGGEHDADTSPVSALAVDPDGSLFVGGDFHSIGGLARHYVAKLSGSGTGAADAVWNVPLLASVAALVVGTDGAIYVAPHGIGMFNLMIQKFSTIGRGEPLADWQPASIVGTADRLALDADGTLYASGMFVHDNTDHRTLIRFMRTGHGMIDVDWNPGPPYVVATALATDTAGSVYVGHSQGIVRWPTARLMTYSDRDFAADGAVNAIVGSASGPITIAGSFTTLDRQEALGLARFGDGSRSLFALASVELPGKANVMAYESDGSLVVGGRFVRAGATARRNILRLDPQGELDPRWNPGADEEIVAVAVDEDDRVYAAEGRRPWPANEIFPTRIFRISEGRVDPTWHASLFGEVNVLAIARGAPGGIYVGGAFAEIGGVIRACVARLSADDGALDPNWDAGEHVRIDALVVDRDGTVYIGGLLGRYGDPSHSPIAKLSAITGQPDSGWSPPVQGEVEALAITLDGSSLYAAVDQGDSHRIVRIRSDGTLDPDWLIDSNDDVRTLVIDDSGALYAGGMFTHLGEQPRAFVGRIAGIPPVVDRQWNPSADDTVAAIVSGSYARIHVGGAFTSIGGQTRIGLVTLPSPWLPGHPQHSRPELLPPPPTPSSERLRKEPASTASSKQR